MRSPEKQLFISYSRVDADYARALSAELVALGFTLWRDRDDMEGGENWWQQIEDAIRGVDTMLLLLSETALASKMVSKEWRYARQIGTRVIPVIAATFMPDRAPRWMSKRDWYDFRNRASDPDQQILWEKLLVQLRTPYQRRRVPFMVEDLPPDYVPRNGVLNAAIAQLVNEQREEPRAVTLALKGAGGYGKTTLARAICADERVQVAFDDGILWVTFGEKVENLTAKVDDLLYSVTGERSNANTLETATAALVEALADRDLLLVLDDVWNAADLKPFVQGGRRCARLITTRDASTLPLDTAKIAVDEMAAPEAFALLRFGLPPGEDAAFARLAERLGYWPLLIKLVNGALRDAVLDYRQPLPAALADMTQGLDEGGLTVFDVENVTDRHKAVARTLELSIGRLSGEERARFESLVIFPEDVDVPLDVVGRLWGLSGVFTRRLCGRLFTMSLLLAYDLDAGTLRLHDVVRDYLKIRSASGSDALHNKLLDSYNVADWSELPEADRYIWQYLRSHLRGAQREPEFEDALLNMNFLAKKTMIVDSANVEADLLWLWMRAKPYDEKYIPHKTLLYEFPKISHILIRCDFWQEVSAVLCNRIIFLGYPIIQEVWRNLLPLPALHAERPLPDLPDVALLRTLDGHRDSVKGVAFSPDGKHLASISDDLTLRLWSYASRPEQPPLRTTSEGRALAWSADGSFLAAAFRDGRIATYDPETWSERAIWKAHEQQVRSLAIHPDSRQIVSGGREGMVRQWNRDGGLIREIAVHSGLIEGVAYSPDGSLIASCDRSGLVVIHDAVSGVERQRRIIAGIRAYSIAFSADGALVAIGGSAGRVVLWNLGDDSQRTLHEQSGDIRSVAFHPHGGHFVSGASDGTVALWSMDTWEPRAVWTDHLGVVRCITWGSDGGFIATGASDRSIKVWAWANALTRNTKNGTDAPRGTYYGIAYTGEGQLIALEKAGRVLALDPTRYFRGFRNDTKAIAAGRDRVLGLNGTNSVKHSNARTGERAGFLVAEEGAVLRTAAYSPDETTLITTSGTEIVQIRSASDLALLREWTAPAKVNHAVYSADGGTVILAAEDGSLLLWLLQTDAVQTLSGHRAPVNGVATSADGRYIASVSSDRTLKVWEGGKCIHTFYADGGLYSLAWNPDGVHLVACGSRGVYWLEWLR